MNEINSKLQLGTDHTLILENTRGALTNPSNMQYMNTHEPVCLPTDANTYLMWRISLKFHLVMWLRLFI